MARPKPELVLSDDERDKLTTWAGPPKSSPRLALQCAALQKRIVHCTCLTVTAA